MAIVNVWVGDDCPYNIETSLPAAEVKALIEQVVASLNECFYPLGADHDPDDDGGIQFSME